VLMGRNAALQLQKATRDRELVVHIVIAMRSSRETFGRAKDHGILRGWKLGSPGETPCRDALLWKSLRGDARTTGMISL